MVPPEASQRPKLVMMTYGASALTQSAIDVSEIVEYRKMGLLSWINIHGVGDVETFRTLGNIFGLHRLALENVVNLQGRAKAESYGDTEINSRMNEVMQLLTMIATIFIPLGVIAGVFGMNFDRKASPWNMPELGWYFGYPFAIGLMALSAGGFLWLFKKRGWLRAAGTFPGSSPAGTPH